MLRPSLYDTLFGNFAGGLDLNSVSEENRLILSVLDNMQRNAGTHCWVRFGIWAAFSNSGRMVWGI